jgi:hypothetical protein
MVSVSDQLAMQFGRDGMSVGALLRVYREQ